MKKSTCEGCGEALEKRRGSQRYHDRKCQQAAYLKRQAQRKPASVLLAPLVVLAGVDTLYVNVYYADPEKTHIRATLPLREETRTHLDTLQQQAKAARKLIETPWSILDESLYSRHHGSKEIWNWILCNDYLNVQIGTGEYRGLIARVRLGAEYLWKVGSLSQSLTLVKSLVKTLFEHEMFLVPGAIDLCADVAHWSVDNLDKDRFLSRAKGGRQKFKGESLIVGTDDVVWNGSKLGTLYFGERTSPVHGKVYDKVDEIKKRGMKKAWFFDLWGRTLPTFTPETVPVSRVELSATSEALRELGIDTCADLHGNLKKLWVYLAGSETVKPWLRYTLPNDDPNRARWPLDPTWKTVQHAFDILSEEEAGELIRVKKQHVNIDAATASIAGYLSSRTAWLCDREELDADDVFLNGVLYELRDDLEALYRAKGLSFQDVLKEKQQRYYLRDTKTREAAMKRVVSLLDNNEQEAT